MGAPFFSAFTQPDLLWPVRLKKRNSSYWSNRAGTPHCACPRESLKIRMSGSTSRKSLKCRLTKTKFQTQDSSSSKWEPERSDGQPHILDIYNTFSNIPINMRQYPAVLRQGVKTCEDFRLPFHMPIVFGITVLAKCLNVRMD